MNKRDLKAYSRFDGTGRIVPGSTVLRRQKPKVGNWKEVPAYECCNYVPANAEQECYIGDRFAGDTYVNISALNGDYYQSISFAVETIGGTTAAEIALNLNTVASQYGSFTAIDGDETNLIYIPSDTLVNLYAGANTTLFSFFINFVE